MPTIDRLIAEHAINFPDRIAVTGAEQSLSYAELVARARATAALLRESGVEPGGVVGIAMRRSPDAVVALLGVLMAGQGYVYLDPDYPTARVAFVVDECAVSHAVVDRLSQWRLPEVTNVPAPTTASRPTDLPSGGRHAGDLCYVCFTSGSTGLPKGVLIEHGGVRNMALGLSSVFGLTARSRVLQFASWNFDAAACEIFATLAAGATLCLAPDPTLAAGPGLAGYLRDQRISFAALTPSVLDALSPDDLPELTAVASVGERCPEDLVPRWAAGRRFFNGYGPTEATVAVSVGELRPGEEVHVGRPIPGVEVQVVDPDRGDAVPAGEPGELWVSGAGVARGYLNQPELTARRFVQDPERRWYRTGDIVRRRPDGVLVFVGRTDNQVKIRGLRVELEEIEAAVRRHHLVRQCVAVPDSAARLVAYVVPADGALTPDLLRETMAAWLPALMMPDRLVLTQSLPLSPLGKIDRSALPRADGAAARTSGDDLTTRVLGILRNATDVPALSPDDDIFDYDVHSLTAALISVGLKTEFGVELSVLTIFDNPTARRLGEVIAPSLVRPRVDDQGTAPRST